jgi:hypothetical protein
MDATKELLTLPKKERSAHFKKMRDQTWGHKDLVCSLKNVIGNKCWYSEIALGGADPNVDHFRPKGRVIEVDADFEKTGADVPDGYWWLAYEVLNFRLSSQHANQRRVDEQTDGGKADFFPVLGIRGQQKTPYHQIHENVLPLDPCSASDVSLLGFDTYGDPIYIPRKGKPSKDDALRVDATIWLYHLDKHDTASLRSKAVDEFRRRLRQADGLYSFWHGPMKSIEAKKLFDDEISEIAAMLEDESPFAGAKRSAIRLAVADYDWIDSCPALIF